MNLGGPLLGLVLLTAASAAASQVALPHATAPFSLQSFYAQASPSGFGSSIAPALEVQPGPPPVPIGEPRPRSPGPPGSARPPLPDYESSADVPNVRVEPSLEGEASGRKAAAEGEGQP